MSCMLIVLPQTRTNTTAMSNKFTFACQPFFWKKMTTRLQHILHWRKSAEAKSRRATSDRNSFQVSSSPSAADPESTAELSCLLAPLFPVLQAGPPR